MNYPENLPGRGWQIIETAGKKVLFAQVLGRLFMPPVNSITEPLDNLLKLYTLGKNIDAILIDIHGEATSEKIALGYYLDGRVSLVAGTHTHVPTADARILPQKPVILPMSACAATLNLFWVLNLRRRWIGWRKTDGAKPAHPRQRQRNHSVGHPY